MLAELSTKNNILAATSPPPAPGGTGFALTLLLKDNTNKKNKILKYLIIIYISNSITSSPDV